MIIHLSLVMYIQGTTSLLLFGSVFKTNMCPLLTTPDTSTSSNTSGICSYKRCFALSLDILAHYFSLSLMSLLLLLWLAGVCSCLLLDRFFHTLMCKHFLEVCKHLLEVFHTFLFQTHNKLKAFRCKHHPRITYYTLNHTMFYIAPGVASVALAMIIFTDLCNIRNQGPFLWWLT